MTQKDKLSATLTSHIELEEAARLQELYSDLYPEIHNWQTKIQKKITQKDKLIETFTSLGLDFTINEYPKGTEIIIHNDSWEKFEFYFDKDGNYIPQIGENNDTKR